MNRGQIFVEPARDHGHRGLGFVLLIVLLIGLAALIGYFAARFAARGHAAQVAAPAGDEPLALLRLRYARGEIDRETFLQTSADLGGLPHPATA
jgi:putative membrane protein